MKSKLLIYVLPVILVAFLIYGYSIQDDPRNDAAPVSTEINNNSVGQDTMPPAGFPYPTQWNFNYSAIAGPNGGTVGAMYFKGKYILNSWNSARFYRYNPDGPNGGPGTLADSNTSYNAGAGAIRDLTVAPDGSGNLYLWGGSASTTLYKLDSLGNRVSSFVHAGAAYRAICWDPNRRGFWSCNFGDNIVCRDTTGAILRTITASAIAGKYGLGFDSTTSADTAFLWVWNQGTGSLTNELVKISLTTGTVVSTYIFNLPAASIGIAGGAEIVKKNNQLLLLLNYQNFAMVGYKMKDLAPPSGGVISVTNHHTRDIADNGGNANPAMDTIYISGIPAGNFIQKITVTMDTVMHTWIGDLRFWVQKQSVVDTTISRIGWTGTGFGNSCDNLFGTRLVDSTGILSVQNMTPATCPANQNANSTGNFTPKSPLNVFTNTDPNGAYILRISDNAAGDVGSLKSWTVWVQYGPMVGVNNNNISIANDYSLSQNYPNPFNPATKISYSIPKSGVVSIKVFDILGKEVTTLVNEFKNAGKYEALFNGSNFSSGVYFYRLESGDFVDTKKMFLVK